MRKYLGSRFSSYVRIEEEMFKSNVSYVVSFRRKNFDKTFTFLAVVNTHIKTVACKPI